MSQPSSESSTDSSKNQGLRALLSKHVIHSPVFPQAVMLLAFLITFGIIRAVTYSIKLGWIPVNGAKTGGLHIHHYVWGIGLLLILGYIHIGFAPRRGRLLSAVVFGIAAALILDEFALLLNLQNVYWKKQGIESVYAVVAAGAVLGLAVLLRTFIRALIHEWRKH